MNAAIRRAPKCRRWYVFWTFLMMRAALYIRCTLSGIYFIFHFTRRAACLHFRRSFGELLFSLPQLYTQCLTSFLSMGRARKKFTHDFARLSTFQDIKFCLNAFASAFLFHASLYFRGHFGRFASRGHMIFFAGMLIIIIYLLIYFFFAIFHSFQTRHDAYEALIDTLFFQCYFAGRQQVRVLSVLTPQCHAYMRADAASTRTSQVAWSFSRYLLFLILIRCAYHVLHFSSLIRLISIFARALFADVRRKE